MKHWAEFLPEVGDPIAMQARDQVNIIEKMNQMWDELKILNEEYINNEIDLRKSIDKNWSISEIITAQQTAEEWTISFNRILKSQ